MRSHAGGCLAAIVLGLSVPLSVIGAAAAAPTKDTVAKPDHQPDPFPAPKSIRQSAIIGGTRVDYQATVGSIAIKDEEGKLLGEVVYTAFTVPSHDPSRPVTFAFNGGPGAASAYLDLGAIGPKRVIFGGENDYPSSSPVLRDNPNSWLDFTDLVFIDPIGTGYSRTRVDEEQTKKAFLTSKSDMEYLSRVVFDWLLQNQRMASRKYLIGESYGGNRVPRMAYYLQTTLGVGISGITMVSPPSTWRWWATTFCRRPRIWLSCRPWPRAISSARESLSMNRPWLLSNCTHAPSSSRTSLPGRPTKQRPTGSGKGRRIDRPEPGAGTANERPSRPRNLPA